MYDYEYFIINKYEETQLPTYNCEYHVDELKTSC